MPNFQGALFSRIANIIFANNELRVLGIPIPYDRLRSRWYAVLFVNSAHGSTPFACARYQESAFEAEGKKKFALRRGNGGCFAAARPRLASLETPLLPTWLRTCTVCCGDTMGDVEQSMAGAMQEEAQ